MTRLTAAAPASVPVQPTQPVSEVSSQLSEESRLQAVYVADVTFEDDEVVQPGTIVKQWRMRNPGPSDWPADTKVLLPF